MLVYKRYRNKEFKNEYKSVIKSYFKLTLMLLKNIYRNKN